MFQPTGRPSLSAAGKIGLLLTASLVPSSAPVSAESLQEALAAAYTYNPKLEVGRSVLRSVDENVSIANAGFRPVGDCELHLAAEQIAQLCCQRHEVYAGSGE